jgi:hypothetical protein
MVKLEDDDRPHASVAVNAKFAVPAETGVPVIENPPLAFSARLKPAGREPELTLIEGTGEKRLVHPPEVVMACW